MSRPRGLPTAAAIITVMPRSELFDLAIERADTYLSRLRPGWELTEPNAAELAATIELWYLRTRFAYRVPLEEVVATLLSKPAVDAVWHGGPSGGWSATSSSAVGAGTLPGVDPADRD